MAPQKDAKPIWIFLLGFALLCVLPMVAFATYMVDRLVKDQREAQLVQLMQRSEAVAAAVDQMLSGGFITLSALASSRPATSGDVAAFYEEAKEFLDHQSLATMITVVDQQGHMLFNTNILYGQPLPEAGELASAQAAILTGKPTASNLFRSAITGTPFFALNMPLTKGTMRNCSLRMIFETARLNTVLAEEVLSPGWFAAVLDSNGTIVARNRSADRFVGQKVGRHILEGMEFGPDGYAKDTTREGIPVLTNYRSLSMGWTVAVGVPERVLDTPVRQSMAMVTVGGVLMLALSIVAAIALSRRLGKRVGQVAKAAVALGERRHLPLTPTGIRELDAVMAAQRHARELITTREHELEQANQWAKAAKEEAERANRAKTQFLAAASHDLRQPVQSMFFLFEILKSKTKIDSSDKALDTMGVALHAIKTILDGLLDISKLHAGTIRPHITDFPVNVLFDQLVEEYAERMAHLGLRLRCVPTRLWVSSDSGLLERVLRNLLDNAAKYTTAGTILMGCRRAGADILLQVVDTGPGIPPEKLEEIWQEFVQLGNPERNRAKGLGLGLAIVRQLCTLLDHQVKVRSRVGGGSVFSVRVPVVPPHAAGDERQAIAVVDPVARSVTP